MNFLFGVLTGTVFVSTIFITNHLWRISEEMKKISTSLDFVATYLEVLMQYEDMKLKEGKDGNNTNR